MAKATIGLDIGTSAVRAVEVKGKDPATITRFAQLGLPGGAVIGGEIADAEAVVSVLHDLWKRGEFKSRRVALALSNQNVVARQVDLPRMDEADLQGALGYQVQDVIPISIADALLDYLLLDEYVAEDGTEMMRVLAVAAQKAMVEQFVGVIASAGLDLAGVDVAPLAAVRALAETVPPVVAERTAEAIVDVGAGVTDVVVHEHGSPRFVRILAMGGNDITAGLVAELNVSVEEAEAQKIALGLQAEGASIEPGPAGIIEQRARAFIEDVRRTIVYYAEQPGAAPIGRVVVTGGGARLLRLRERLSGALRLPVEEGRPLDRVAVGDIGLSPEQLEQVAAVAAVALGLALED